MVSYYYKELPYTIHSTDSSAAIGSAYRPVRPIGPKARGEGSQRRVRIARGETERATSKHGGRKTRHRRGFLDVKVAIYFVRPPSADQSDAVAVNSGTEESHSAACAGGANRDVDNRIRWIRMQVERGPNVVGEVGRQDVTVLTRSGNDSI